MNIARYVTGWEEVSVTGAEPEKALYALAERGIAFWEATPPKAYSLTLKTSPRAAKLIAEIAPSLGCEARIVSRHGLPALLRRLLKRPALLFFLAAALSLLLTSKAFIWEVEITGNETISNAEIRQALSDCGVDIGAYWPAFSQDQIRNSMILRLPGIRWMTVTVEGCRAKVIIREKRTYIEPVDDEELVNIVAEKAGLVTEVLALRGTAVTAVNKAVLPGEVLIGGYATGRFGVQGEIRAIGTVMARTWYELTAEAPTEIQVKQVERAGKTLFALVLGGKRINFYKGSSICQVDCDKIIEKHMLGIEGVFLLPITLEKTVLTGYTTVSQQAEELREELEQQLMDELLSRIGEEATVTTANFTASQTDGLLYVTLRAECLEQIGTEAPLTEEEIREIRQKIPNTEETDP